MAISKTRKQALVTQYVDLLDQSNAIFLAEYAGIPVSQLESFRDEVRNAEGSFKVTKNTLLRIALEQSGKPIPSDLLNGQLGTGFALGEAPTLAKALVNFAKDEDNFVIKGGVMGEEILSAEQVEALAKLPNLDQLRSQLLSVINAPARNIAATVAAGVRQVINVVDAYAKQEEDGDVAEAPA